MKTLDWPDVPYIGPATGCTSGRPDGRPVLGLLHCTANDATPTQEATYAHTRAASSNPTSAHLYAGDASPSLVQGVAVGDCAWHAGGHFGNRRGVGLEITGQVSWSRSRWLRGQTIPAAARAVRLLSDKTGIRMRWLDRAGLIELYEHPTLAHSGWVTHYQYNQWCPDAKSDHNDPGPGFPLDLVMQLAIEGDDMSAADVVAGLDEAVSWRSTGIRNGAVAAGWSSEVSSRALLEYVFGRTVLGPSTAEVETQVAGLTAAIQALAAGGSSVDTAAVIAAVNAQAAETRSQILTRLAAAGTGLTGG